MSKLEEAWEPEVELSDITIRELDAICKSYADMREIKKKLEDEVEEISKKAKELERKIVDYLSEFGKESYKGDFGTISTRVTKSFLQPESLESKRELFEYLKSKNIFEEMVAVNSRTLSSWATKEVEARESLGQYGWVPPGLKPPHENIGISLRKK